MMQFFRYNLKKKNFFFSLIIYFIFLTYKILSFFQIDITTYQNHLQFFSYLQKSNDIIYMKINTSNILSIFSNYCSNSKYIFTIFKRDLLIVSAKNLTIFNNYNNIIIFNNLVMVCIDNFFINVKYILNIFNLHQLLSLNFDIYKIFILKFFYINYCYINKFTNKIN